MGCIFSHSFVFIFSFCKLKKSKHGLRYHSWLGTHFCGTYLTFILCHKCTSPHYPVSAKFGIKPNFTSIQVILMWKELSEEPQKWMRFVLRERSFQDELPVLLRAKLPTKSVCVFKWEAVVFVSFSFVTRTFVSIVFTSILCWFPVFWTLTSCVVTVPDVKLGFSGVRSQPKS